MMSNKGRQLGGIGTMRGLRPLFMGISLFVGTSLILTATALSPVGKLSAQNQTSCTPNQALANFDTFMAAAISYEGFTEYWKEVLGLHNDCQYEDIQVVNSQIDGIENRIRQAFFSCQNQQVEQLKPQYNKLRAELYYVRNYVITKDGAFLLANEAKLKEDMREKFVNQENSIGDGSFETYFDEFKKKYAERPQVYQKCSKSPWEDVNKKWKEVQKHFDELGKSLEPKPSPPKPKNANADTAKNAAKNKGGSFLSKLFDVNLNGQDPAKSGDQIIADLKKTVPSLDTPNVSTVISGLADSQSKTVELKSKKEIITRYEALYKQTGDQAFTDLELQMDGLNKIISETTKVLAKLKGCTKNVAGRQCK